MRVLVFQHIACEHPGIFRSFMEEGGTRWDAVEIDEGEPIPPLEDYDALFVMGGPMDVWQEEAHPWLVAEKKAIRDWVGQQRPYLGLCLGHQLLADALGGRVGKMPAPEIGVCKVELTQAGRSDPLMQGLPPSLKALQWHGAAVLEAPPGAAVLARSPLCEIQALRVGPSAWSVQYHVEIEADTVDNWAAVPEYACALAESLGENALPGFKKAVAVEMTRFNDSARRLYENFMREAKARLAIGAGALA